MSRSLKITSELGQTLANQGSLSGHIFYLGNCYIYDCGSVRQALLTVIVGRWAGASEAAAVSCGS